MTNPDTIAVIVGEMRNVAGSSNDYDSCELDEFIAEWADRLAALDVEKDGRVRCLCQAIDRFNIGAKIAAIPTSACSTESAAKVFAHVRAKEQTKDQNDD